MCVCVFTKRSTCACVRVIRERIDWIRSLTPLASLFGHDSLFSSPNSLSLSVSTARRRKKTSRICCASNWRFFSFAFSCRRLMTHSTAPWAGLPVLSYSLPIFLLLFSIWSSIGCERACFLSFFLFCASFSMPLCCISRRLLLSSIFGYFLYFRTHWCVVPRVSSVCFDHIFLFFRFMAFKQKKNQKKKSWCWRNSCRKKSRRTRKNIRELIVSLILSCGIE